MNCSSADDPLLSLVEKQLGKVDQTARLVLAFSGGLDSSVLLHLLSRLPHIQPRLHAVHVHHGLSVNADAWARTCQQACEQRQLPCTVEKVHVNVQGQGLEQAARRLRYQALQKHLKSGDVLLTAHHSDDQIETFFQRLLRGSGLSGLSAMAQQRSLANAHLLRPLLPVSRQQLEGYAKLHQINWIDDESNQDQQLERNWWRQHLLPQLWQRYPNHQKVVVRSIEQLQDDKAMLSELVRPYLEQCLDSCSWPNTQPRVLSVEQLVLQSERIQPYIVRAWLECCGLVALSAIQLQRVFTEVLPAALDKQPQISCGEWTLQRFKGGLYLWQSPNQRPLPKQVPALQALTDKMPWYGGTICSGGDFDVETGDCFICPAATVSDQTIQLKGRPGKTFKHLWQEHHIPVWLREYWPVCVDAKGQVISVIDLAIAKKYDKKHDVGWFWQREPVPGEEI